MASIDKLIQPEAMLAAAGVAALASRNIPDAVQYTTAVSLAFGASRLMKHLVSEHRPRLFDSSPEQSFPSGHATMVSAFATSLAITSRRWWAFPIAAVAIGAVDYMRVREREHWPVDVLVGNAIGIGAAFVGYALSRLAARSSVGRAPTSATRQGFAPSAGQ